MGGNKRWTSEVNEKADMNNDLRLLFGTTPCDVEPPAATDEK